MTLEELLKQKSDLERQIAAHQSESRANAIAQIRDLMTLHGLTAADLAATPKRANSRDSSRSAKPVAAKYKDDQGNSWSGRGLRPKWLTAALASGRKIEDFAV